MAPQSRTADLQFLQFFLEEFQFETFIVFKQQFEFFLQELFFKLFIFEQQFEFPTTYLQRRDKTAVLEFTDLLPKRKLDVSGSYESMSWPLSDRKQLIVAEIRIFLLQQLKQVGFFFEQQLEFFGRLSRLSAAVFGQCLSVLLRQQELDVLGSGDQRDDRGNCRWRERPRREFARVCRRIILEPFVDLRRNLRFARSGSAIRCKHLQRCRRITAR